MKRIKILFMVLLAISAIFSVNYKKAASKNEKTIIIIKNISSCAVWFSVDNINYGKKIESLISPESSKSIEIFFDNWWFESRNECNSHKYFKQISVDNKSYKTFIWDGARLK